MFKEWQTGTFQGQLAASQKGWKPHGLLRIINSHDSWPWEISLPPVCCHLRLNPVVSRPQEAWGHPCKPPGRSWTSVRGPWGRNLTWTSVSAPQGSLHQASSRERAAPFHRTSWGPSPGSGRGHWAGLKGEVGLDRWLSEMLDTFGWAGSPTTGIQPLSLLQRNTSNAQDYHSETRAKGECPGRSHAHSWSRSPALLTPLSPSWAFWISKLAYQFSGSWWSLFPSSDAPERSPDLGTDMTPGDSEAVSSEHHSLGTWTAHSWLHDHRSKLGPSM